jgi:hypothetical protein
MACIPSWPLEDVDEPWGKGDNWVGVVFFLELQYGIDFHDKGLLIRGVFSREPSDMTIREQLDPVDGQVKVVLNGDESSSGGVGGT